MFINEVSQKPMTRVSVDGAPSDHRAAVSLFGVDSNTANVSIASGGTRTY